MIALQWRGLHMQVLNFLKGGKFEKISRWMWQDNNYKEVTIRVGPQVEKSSNLHITADSTGSIHKNARGKKFDPKKVRLGWGNLIWKFGIWAFSAIFVLFFWVAKTLIYIDNAFNGYSYLKSTRKELSDGTLMLKKEYRLAR